MAELLIEVGCEELPASFVMRAVEDLRDALQSRLSSAFLQIEGSPAPTVYATPRRLIVHFAHILDHQPDVTKDVRGPAVKAAFDADGKHTKPLEGFCRGQGVDPSAVRVEGDYVFVTVTALGQPAEAVLSTLVPDAIRSLTFDKTMRWAHHRMRFARPIRWVLALLDDVIIPFEIEGVVASNQSRGHRFNFPEPFVVTSASQLIDDLRGREVEPDPAIRIQRIKETAIEVSQGQADLSESLVAENAFLCEWPRCVKGSFDAEFLKLPEPVLVTVMAKHERFFPVRDSGGNVTNEFVSVRNGGVDEVVAAGNAWVLNARLNDAKFFYDEDRKHTLQDFLAKTEGIVFQAELGTVRERADRLSKLCIALAQATTNNDAEEMEFARLAGLLAKADLSSGLVSELAELQGVIGAEYARREGVAEPVCWAIQSHYAPESNPHPDGPSARTALRLILADQLDKLAGYLGLGLVPSGSSDPFGLRRAAGVVMEVALRWPASELRFDRLLQVAMSHYVRPLDAETALKSARDLFRQRYETLMPDVKSDWLDAVLVVDPDLVFQPSSVQARLAILAELAGDHAFVQAATRPLKITAAAEKKGIVIGTASDEALESAEGNALRTALSTIARADISGLRSLQAPIDAFFESTMVMVDDERIRNARLALLRDVSDKLKEVADFSKIVVEG